MSTALVWFRRDLRLADQPALRKAVDEHEHVVPVFIWAPREEAPWAPGAASRVWLHHSLKELASRLAERGSPLVLRRGATLETLQALVKETGADAVYWNRLYEPAIVERDTRIKEYLRGAGIAAESFRATLLFEPWELETEAKNPFRVFSPFWRAASERLLEFASPLPAVRKIPGPARQAATEALDDLCLLPSIGWDQEFTEVWQPGEMGAQAQFEHFCAHVVQRYKELRDLPGSEGTSRLSPHLHFGEVGPLSLLHRLHALQQEHRSPALSRNCEHFLRELGWREFAHHLLFHFPLTTEAPLQERFARFPWRADYQRDLRAWQQGQTGIPIVDAGMRQLWRTGWMHNRVRMVAASLLTKNLLVPWQEGAAWFWDTLVDADLANNTLGWQWVAGSGADAAPYFRVFNPVLQSVKFDPGGDYLRRFVPEIADLEAAVIHAPWDARAGAPKGYPAPIVNLPDSRRRALDAFATVKER